MNLFNDSKKTQEELKLNKKPATIFTIIAGGCSGFGIGDVCGISFVKIEGMKPVYAARFQNVSINGKEKVY